MSFGIDDQVRPQSQNERSLLEEVAKASGRRVEDLIKVWRQPSFSVANVVGSGEGNRTVIPNRVKAEISMRIVPDQVSLEHME
jgi:di- and tripeptidase